MTPESQSQPVKDYAHEMEEYWVRRINEADASLPPIDPKTYILSRDVSSIKAGNYTIVAVVLHLDDELHSVTLLASFDQWHEMVFEAEEIDTDWHTISS